MKNQPKNLENCIASEELGMKKFLFANWNGGYREYGEYGGRVRQERTWIEKQNENPGFSGFDMDARETPYSPYSP